MKNIVIKISSNLINPDHPVDFLEVITAQIKELKEQDINLIIVTSGAVMFGLKKLGLDKRPDRLPMLQSCASIGQISLMGSFQALFEKHNLIPGQILLSADDFKVRQRYLNLRNTIDTLLELNVIPIFNENDSVNTEELKLGDNDHLSSLITIMMDFDLLIILSDVAGLYDKDPKKNKDAKLISTIHSLDDSYLDFATGSVSRYSTGGMKKKLESAQKVHKAGIDVFIGEGFSVNLRDVLKNKAKGTYIKGIEKKPNARKKWLAFSPSGDQGITIDDGAYKALCEKQSSLLPSGITGVKGRFETGSLISIYWENKKIAQGLTNYSSGDIRHIKGKQTSQVREIIQGSFYEVVVHKNNLYLL